MPAWVMHCWVADAAWRSAPALDRGQLLLGALAPDAADNPRASHGKGPRYASSDGAPFGVAAFHRRYAGALQSPDPSEAAFYRGWLTHLLADDLMASWLHFAGLKPVMDRHPRGRAVLYDDYEHLNGVVAGRLTDRRGVVAALATAHLRVARPCGDTNAERLEAVRQETLRQLQRPDDSPVLAVLTVDGVWAFLERAAARAVDAVGSWPS